MFCLTHQTDVAIEDFSMKCYCVEYLSLKLSNALVKKFQADIVLSHHHWFFIADINDSIQWLTEADVGFSTFKMFLSCATDLHGWLWHTV